MSEEPGRGFGTMGIAYTETESRLLPAHPPAINNKSVAMQIVAGR